MKSFLVLFALFAFAACIDNSVADQCQACKKIFNFISNVTHNGDDSVKGRLADLCSEYSYLPGKQAKTWCTKAIDGFFNAMNKNLNTSTVCYDIKACTVGDDDNGLRELVNVGKKEDCDFCIYVATQAKSILTGGPTEVEIRTILEDGCHYLQNFENECLNLIDQYVNDLFTFVNQTFQPAQMCKSLHVCAARTGPLAAVKPALIPSATELVNILPVNVSLATETPVKDLNCDLCKKLVKIIQTQLKDNATDQQIINVLTDVCDLAPSKEQAKCKAVVIEYTKQLIQVLTRSVDPDLACTLVGLCVPQTFWNYINGHYVKPTTPVSKINKNVVCVECQLITHFIQNELYNYKNEEQIEEFIKNHFCKKMAMFVNESSCDAFIQDYGPIIMQTIAQEIFDPTTFCFKEIHVCTKAKVSEVIMFNQQDKRCEMCKDIVSSLHQAESHDLELDPLIEKACNHLPRAHRVECGLMMKAFAPYFFDVLNHHDSPKDICKSIDICMVPGNVHLLGGHKCTYGPAYWCHSVAHSDACNASDYCRQKVWKAISN